MGSWKHPTDQRLAFTRCSPRLLRQHYYPVVITNSHARSFKCGITLTTVWLQIHVKHFFLKKIIWKAASVHYVDLLKSFEVKKIKNIEYICYSGLSRIINTLEWKGFQRFSVCVSLFWLFVVCLINKRIRFHNFVSLFNFTGWFTEQRSFIWERCSAMGVIQGWLMPPVWFMACVKMTQSITHGLWEFM